MKIHDSCTFNLSPSSQLRNSIRLNFLVGLRMLFLFCCYFRSRCKTNKICIFRRGFSSNTQNTVNPHKHRLVGTAKRNINAQNPAIQATTLTPICCSICIELKMQSRHTRRHVAVQFFGRSLNA